MEDDSAPGTAQAPPTLGEGCLARYDPAVLTEAHGAQFEGAEQLWQSLEKAQDDAKKEKER